MLLTACSFANAVQTRHEAARDGLSALQLTLQLNQCCEIVAQWNRQKPSTAPSRFT